ncbi:hypothetical protein GCM10010981_17880 [Dyella nitratireducens]|uniref:Uncharacterized protein n=1 Tax=Dyella nitratireducens TaxID=1849580 RepID=A0ABQ1FTT6_9GAMM|nr:hypothetical protein GCM10010981_17880 [Dyella nitratireducens]GLQ43147.1 hypothetical protein GCM10007902_29970 [Dyella nitratireducens]
MFPQHLHDVRLTVGERDIHDMIPAWQSTKDVVDTNQPNGIVNYIYSTCAAVQE